MKYYLAYGSNMSVTQMDHRCPRAVYVGAAELKDYRLLFKGSKSGCYLTVEPMKGRTVPCLVWMVDEKDEGALDRYEGCPTFYKKKDIRVALRSLTGDDLGEVDAFFYQMDRRRGPGAPEWWYFDVCEEGYDRFGFDKDILFTALDESTKGVAI